MACNRRPQLHLAASLLLLGLAVAAAPSGAQPVGVCYGWLGNDLPPPAEVVGLYRSLNIPRMRIYAPSEPVLRALRRSNIELILDCPGPLQTLAQNPAAASDWVRTNVLAYWPDVRIRYIAVGNEEILKPGVAEHILPAMINIYKAVAAAGLQNQIKISTSVQYNVMGVSYPPSAGAFSAEALPVMRPIAAFLALTASPLLVNVYPYFSYAGNPRDIALDYALFTAAGTVVVDPNTGLEYQNLFDAMVDAVHAALDGMGFGSAAVDLVVSETGWPSAGGFAANVENAKTYNSNMVRHARRGTPMKPGKPVETYIFAMFNENQKTPPGIENNFGLFYPDKRPVYPISFDDASILSIAAKQEDEKMLSSPA